jgi:hypothetical protein
LPKKPKLFLLNEACMADLAPSSPSPAPAPVTEAAFMADRQRMWNGFTGAVFKAAVAVAVALILLAYFTL